MLKVTLRYSRNSIPICIEVESEALTPTNIPSILGSILEQLESRIDVSTSKTHSESAGRKRTSDQGQGQPHLGPAASAESLRGPLPRDAVSPAEASQNEL